MLIFRLSLFFLAIAAFQNALSFKSHLVAEMRPPLSVGKATGESEGPRPVFFSSRQIELSFLLKKASAGELKPETHLSVTDLEKETDDFVFSWVLVEEANLFNVANLRSEILESEIKKVQRSLSGNRRYRELSFSPDEVRLVQSVLYRSRVFIQLKRESSVVFVSEKEAKEYFAANQDRFGSLAFESFQANITSYLQREKINAGMTEWFSLLRTKYAVRNFVSEGKNADFPL